MMSVTSFTVRFPNELIEDSKEAAEMIGTDRTIWPFFTHTPYSLLPYPEALLPTPAMFNLFNSRSKGLSFPLEQMGNTPKTAAHED